MAFYVLKGDLLDLKVDAIVAAANINLRMVEGVTRAIFHRAGDAKMKKACSDIGHCRVGHAVMTPSFDFKTTKAIIHAVGPNYINGKHNEEANLRSAYEDSLRLLLKEGYKSIAFPLLSGEFNYPLREAYEIACDVLIEFVKAHNDIDIFLVMYKNFPLTIDTIYKDEIMNYLSLNEKSTLSTNLNIKDNNEFVELTNRYIKSLKYEEEDLIFKANIKGDLLFKLHNDPQFIPSKKEAIALSIAFELDFTCANEYINKLGHSFENSNIHDIVIKYFIENKIYDIYTINNALFNYNFPSLGEEFN